MDNEPLLAGSISFAPIDDTPGSGGGSTIDEGKYRVSKGLAPGKYRIEIQGTRRDTTRRVPEPIGGSLIYPEVQVVPPQYNKNSELVETIQAGENPLDFNLIGFRDQ